jgi:hypothetical protein
MGGQREMYEVLRLEERKRTYPWLRDVCARAVAKVVFCVWFKKGAGLQRAEGELRGRPGGHRDQCGAALDGARGRISSWDVASLGRAGPVTGQRTYVRPFGGLQRPEQERRVSRSESDEARGNCLGQQKGEWLARGKVVVQLPRRCRPCERMG